MNIPQYLLDEPPSIDASFTLSRSDSEHRSMCSTPSRTTRPRRTHPSPGAHWFKRERGKCGERGERGKCRKRKKRGGSSPRRDLVDRLRRSTRLRTRLPAPSLCHLLWSLQPLPHSHRDRVSNQRQYAPRRRTGQHRSPSGGGGIV